MIELFCFLIMKAAAFLNLPVKSGVISIVDLNSINAQVVLLCYWMLGVNKWKSDEWSTIFLPRG